MSATFGDDSVQAMDEREKLLRFDDVDLKNRAEKFKEFLDWNNEKATKAFCRLGREGGLCDDITQIKNNEGNAFNTGAERGEHIRKYYEGLYKKKLDRLIEIEDFLTNECMGEEWVRKRRLTDDERDSLEGGVTLLELEESLNNSNMDSTSGWDGISFKVIKKYWAWLGPIMLKMTNDTFAQKGFMKNKSIHSCSLNIMSTIAEAWGAREEVGVLCVDFSKAFDSIEHDAIRNCLKFFNIGNVMVGMVMTILNDRKARIVLDSFFSLIVFGVFFL
jgi:hypothetical protein